MLKIRVHVDYTQARLTVCGSDPTRLPAIATFIFKKQFFVSHNLTVWLRSL